MENYNKLKIENGKLKINSLNNGISDNLSTKGVDSGKLIVDSYEKLKIENGKLKIENGELKMENYKKLKIDSNLNNSKDMESKGIKKDMGFEMEM